MSWLEQEGKGREFGGGRSCEILGWDKFHWPLYYSLNTGAQ